MPFVRLLIPLVVGIFIGLRSGVTLPVMIPLSFWVLLFTVYIFQRKKSSYRFSYLYSLPVFFFLLIGGWYFTGEKLSGARSVELPEDSMLIARVLETPKETEKSVSLQIEIEAYKHLDVWYDGIGKTIVYLQKDSVARSLDAGMLIGFQPDFDDISNAGNPGEFDYAKYMAYHMISSQTYLKSGKWMVVDYKSDGSLKTWFLKLRNRLLQTYQDAGLEGDEYAVAAALSLGYKDKLQDELRHAYSSSGAMHVLAVSGLHVGIIFLVMQFILGAFKRIRKLIPLQVVLLVLSIWFYAMLTGLSPSVTRAAIMFSFISFGKLFRQNVNIYNILAASAFLTLVINPLNLTELGFWLSYVAVLSIVTFFQPIYDLVKPRYKLLDKLWSLVAVSLAAQIGTAPLTVYYFHQSSNYFLLTNIIVIPIVTIIVYLAILLFFVSLLSVPVITGVFGTALEWLISLLNSSVFWIEQLPAAVSENLYISKTQMFILYAAVICLTVYFIMHKRKAVYPSILFLIVFVCLGIVRDMGNQRDDKFIVYNLRGSSGVNFIMGEENVLFTDFQSDKLEKNTANLKNFWLAEGAAREKYVDVNKLTSRYMMTNILSVDNPALFQKEGFLAFRDFKMLLVVDDRFSDKTTATKLNLDYIVLSLNAKVKLEDLINCFEFECIILDSSNSFYYRKKIKEAAERLNVTVYDVGEQGAFIKNLS